MGAEDQEIKVESEGSSAAKAIQNEQQAFLQMQNQYLSQRVAALATELDSLRAALEGKTSSH